MPETTSTTISGIDISRHQGSVNFKQITGQHFVIVKASEGGDYEDPKFRAYWDGLVKDAPGLLRGAYHFARSDLRQEQGKAAGELEARNFCALLKAVRATDGPFLPPALDWEKYGGTPKRNLEWIRGFVHVVRQELGRDPMIYTGPNVWYYTTDDSDEFVDLPLWEVNYTKQGALPSASPRAMPRKSGRKKWPWTIWQWSGGGDFAHADRVPGVPGVCDVNRFNGTLAALKELAAADSPPSEPSTPAVIPPHEPGQSIMPLVDLAELGVAARSQIAAVVQGLLLASGHGPDGLVGADGLPDGKPGARTLAALRAFKQEHGLANDTLVDPITWWLLQSG